MSRSFLDFPFVVLTLTDRMGCWSSGPSAIILKRSNPKAVIIVKRVFVMLRRFTAVPKEACSTVADRLKCLTDAKEGRAWNKKANEQKIPLRNWICPKVVRVSNRGSGSDVKPKTSDSIHMRSVWRKRLSTVLSPCLMRIPSTASVRFVCISLRNARTNLYAHAYCMVPVRFYHMREV